jgi:hypothetical protein
MGIEIPGKFLKDIVEKCREAIQAIWNGVFNLSWIRKKQLQAFIRTHLSHVLAIILLILVIIRELPEIKGLLFDFVVPTPFTLLILIIVGLTFVACLWELFGNKLTTSPQELRFHWGAKRALKRLEALHFELLDSTSDPQSVFESFLIEVLEIAANTFSGRLRVDAGVMTKEPHEEVLVLRYRSSLANYPNALRIPIPPGNDFSETGPAGLAFARDVLVYVPHKNTKRSWPFVSLDDLGATGLLEPRYEADYPVVCWVAAPNPGLEDFHSVICVPIGTPPGNSPQMKFGVLNLSTKARDRFVHRDFHMAQFYAAMLTQAFVALSERLSNY